MTSCIIIKRNYRRRRRDLKRRSGRNRHNHDDHKKVVYQKINDDDVDEEEIETLGGLVFMLAGRIPARGEVVPHPDGAEFEVIDADPRRIKRLRVRLRGAEPAE